MIAEIIIYTIIFIIGTMMGSFLTLAVYRIPLKQDITHKRSYCPNCNHRLQFLDLIPIFSYIFLKGKCRYCGNKIRARYILLEILSGITFLAFALSTKLNVYAFNYNTLIYLFFGFLYFIGIILIGGIDKEYKKIEESVLIYGLFVVSGYILYLYIVKFNIYRYVMYLILAIILLLISLIKNIKLNYAIEMIVLSIIMSIYSTNLVTLATLLFTCIYAIIRTFVNGMRKKNEKFPIAFYMCFINIILLIIKNFIVI